jgi:hypothetical protein
MCWGLSLYLKPSRRFHGFLDATAFWSPVPVNSTQVSSHEELISNTHTSRFGLKYNLLPKTTLSAAQKACTF